jgi:hypothetical protein
LEPKDYANDIPYFDFSPYDDLDSHLRRSRTDDGVNRLLLLLGKGRLHNYTLHHFALILEETDVHGTYKRVGLWCKARSEQEYIDWTIKSLTII